jgi:hypothetical protein
MEVDKKGASVLENAINQWQQEQVIDEGTARRLRAGYIIREDNAGVLSVYAFIAAVSCGLLAFGALVMDEKWIELLRRQFGFSEIIVGLVFSGLTVLFTWLAKKRRHKHPDTLAANEAFTVTIVMSVAVALAYLGRSVGYMGGNYAPILFIAAVAYGTLAGFLRGHLLWIAALVCVCGWWGAQTYYWSAGRPYFLGMNYALNMTLFGALVWLGSLLIKQLSRLTIFFRSTYICGLLIFLTAAWTLSIFGNNGSFEGWLAMRQGKLWYWALLFTVLLVALLFYAIKKKEDTLRDICLLFLLLNIYTRYFEYFWDRTNKGLFFAILALSFWWVGKKAEQWRRKQIEN